MVVLMVLTFLISWLPYASLAMLVVSKPEVEIHPLVGTVPVYLAKSSTVYNPLIYIYLNKQVLTPSAARSTTQGQNAMK